MELNNRPVATQEAQLLTGSSNRSQACVPWPSLKSATTPVMQFWFLRTVDTSMCIDSSEGQD